MASERRDIQKHVLPNGLVVITETMPHVRSVPVGVWVRNGSRREVPEENGLAHFMEHMVFKGTERRSAEAIAREMDRSEEHTSELQSRLHLVCRLLLEKKKKKNQHITQVEIE